MVNSHLTIALRCTRTRTTGTGFMDHAILAPIFGQLDHGVVGRASRSGGLAQGRIMSISRGSPPLKKR